MNIEYTYLKILTTIDISSKITEILSETKEYCFIVSPYLDTWPQFEKHLEIAAKQGKRVIFLVRDDQTGKPKIIELYKKYHFDIFFIENLHAKIYTNERQALISSMNLYDASQRNNYEIGTLITSSKTVQDITRKIIIDDMIPHWTKNIWKGNFHDLLKDGLFFEKNLGYCINCRKPIKFTQFNNDYYNRSYYYKTHYYCNDCIAKTPNIEKDWILNGNYCHKCGNKFDTSTEKPLCRQCWEEEAQRNYNSSHFGR